MKNGKHLFKTLLPVLVLLAGLSLLLYPGISSYWNSLHQTRAIASYAEEVTNLDSEQYAKLLENAREYNRMLSESSVGFVLSEEQLSEYEALLDISGRGIMGYIEIPELNTSLPIYHGTDESVLQIAVGHLEWSSLPVGGESTHCVLSGHRGLPSAKLFTNLDQLQSGDIFTLRVLDEAISYEVDQILIVEPYEVESLSIIPGEDLCTLVTCTPYGINTHRLLVRGHRVDSLSQAQTIHITADAVQIEPLVAAPIISLPFLLIFLLLVLVPKKLPLGKNGGNADETT